MQFAYWSTTVSQNKRPVTKQKSLIKQKKTDKKIPEPDDVFHEKDNDVCGKKRYILAIRSVTGFKKAE